jgi:hypothetical protein
MRAQTEIEAHIQAERKKSYLLFVATSLFAAALLALVCLGLLIAAFFIFFMFI